MKVCAYVYMQYLHMHKHIHKGHAFKNIFLNSDKAKGKKGTLCQRTTKKKNKNAVPPPRGSFKPTSFSHCN